MCKTMIIIYSIILVIPMIWLCAADYADLPCNARSTNKSVVCVCTADYCDTVIRETPVSGEYMTYTSSEDGERFNKTNGILTTCSEDATYDMTLTLDPNKIYQIIYGFGGAATDAAGINYANLNDTTLQEYFIESYCSTKGLEYSMLRVPIGGTDFSTHGYGYNELPVNDTTLSNFTLTYEDYEYKLPLIKACMAASNTSINMLASLWSPPTWMKTVDSYNNFSQLKDEYFQTLADYVYKFLEAYAAEGVDMWGITLTNEPVNGVTSAHNCNSLGWPLDKMAAWLVDNLGPTLRNTSSPFADVKMLACDENRYLIPMYYNLLVRTYPETMDYIDGVAVHWYSDLNVSATVMQKAMEKSPDKFLLYTEASIIPASMGEYPIVIVDYGSWTRAEKYIKNIIENLNFNVTGWLDWNMALNPAGGPSWLNHKLDSPIIVDADAGEFIKQPLFYAMGHFSKFIPQGSYRIGVNVSSACEIDYETRCYCDIHNVAFITPANNIVVVVYNAGSDEKSVSIGWNDYTAAISVGAKTITTMEFPSC